MHWLVWVGLGVAVAVALGAYLWRRARRRSQGPFSIVMLRDRPRTLTEAEVRQAYRHVVGEDADVQPVRADEHTTGFIVVGKSGGPPVYVICSHRPYVRDPADVAGGAEHQDVRRAVREHTAWISVDALGHHSPKDVEVLVIVYTVLAKIASHFFDDRTTLLYQPAAGRIGLVTPQTADQLGSGRHAEIFASDDVNMPITVTKPGDERIAAAVAEARQRLPELIEAIERLGQAANALVKISFDSTVDGKTGKEYIWCTIDQVSPTTFTVKIQNAPLDPSHGKKGDTVTVPHDRVVDWAFVDGKKVRGMFVERILTPGRF